MTGKESSYHETGSIAVGKGGKLTAGPDFSGSKGAVTYTVTNNSGVSESGVSSLVDKIVTTSQETASKFAGLLDQQNEKVSALAETRQATPEEAKNKSVLIIAVIAVLGAVAILLWKK